MLETAKLNSFADNNNDLKYNSADYVYPVQACTSQCIQAIMYQVLDLSNCLVCTLIAIIFVGCKEVYISPSTKIDKVNSSSSCASGTHSCMSISEIAASDLATVTIPSESNLTIVFLPGSHILKSTNFFLNTIPYVTMKSKGIRDGSSSYMIKCHNSSRFQFRFNTLVHIRGLAFHGCFETEIYRVNKFVMEDCQLFGGKTPVGRGLVVTHSTMNIRRVHIISFIGSVSHKGGAMYCSQSSVHLSDCVLTMNSAISGAAVHVEDSSTVVVSNCLFSNHTVCNDNTTDGIQHDSVVYTNVSSAILSDSSFSNESFYLGNVSVTNNCNGGVLSALNSNISISGCIFMGNTAFNGGVAYCHRGARLMISKTKFTQNEATNYGGVFHQLNCDIQIVGSNFSQNSGKLGGVLYHTAEQSVNKLEIESSNFHNNSADRGGGIYFAHGTTEINGCHFGSNTVSEHGGAIFLSFTNVTIISNRFENNEAITLGGALRVMNDSQVYISGTTSFENNSAFYGPPHSN